MAPIASAFGSHVLTPAWSKVRSWKPIKIDALGLVTLLGAEEVSHASGSLVKRRFTEYLPLLGAFMIAGDRFADRQLGYTLSNITDGIQTTQLPGWFTRWLAAQKLSNSTTVFHLEYSEPPRGSLNTSIPAFIISCCITLPLLPMAVLMSDWWGVANALAIICSVGVRACLVRTRRSRLEDVASPAPPVHGSDESPLYSSDRVTVFVERPDGKFVTIHATRPCLAMIARDIREPSARYHMVRMLGWVAFAIHACVLGMCTLFSQIYTVVLLVGSTVIFVHQFSWDLFHGLISEVDSFPNKATISRRRDLNNGVEFTQEEHRFEYFNKLSSDKRMYTYVRAQLTSGQEEMLKRWDLMPVSGVPWYSDYQEAKEHFHRDRETRDRDSVARPEPVASP